VRLRVSSITFSSPLTPYSQEARSTNACSLSGSSWALRSRTRFAVRAPMYSRMPFRLSAAVNVPKRRSLASAISGWPSIPTSTRHSLRRASTRPNGLPTCARWLVWRGFRQRQGIRTRFMHVLSSYDYGTIVGKRPNRDGRSHM